MIRTTLISRPRTLTGHLLAILALALLLGCPGMSLLPGIAAEANPSQIATTFVSLLVRGDFHTAEQDLNPTMQVAAPEAQLRQIWQGLVAQLGAFERQAGVTQQTDGVYRNVTVNCVFAHASADLVVTVDETGKIAGFHVANVRQVVPYTAPSYVHRASFHEKSVTVGHAPWALPGTLTLPNGHGPFPAVVLVAGSGPNDRDETVGDVKPFQDLAWGLASRGIAVLRYDKRTLVYGARIAKLTNFTVQDEFISDAVAAVDLLSQTSKIDHHHIFVLGHSEGGMVAPRIAAQAPQIAGLIIMAAPTRPMEDVIVSQLIYLQSKGLATAAQVAAARRQAAAIRALTPKDRGHAGFLFDAPPSYWLDLRNYHPAGAAQRLTIPMLIMQGGRDYQVTLADFDSWKSALKGHPHVSFKLYPNLFHPFIPVPAGSQAGLATPDAYNHPGHVAARVIDDLAVWIKTTGITGSRSR